MDRAKVLFTDEQVKASVQFNNMLESVKITFGYVELRLFPHSELYPSNKLVPIGGMKHEL